MLFDIILTTITLMTIILRSERKTKLVIVIKKRVWDTLRLIN